ncbi:WbqC family protein [Shewanella donghaensis]|uniref:WbqC family protein n=1 Tax=Shewanella donghaensis TaxID=238836 RepID=UPI001183E117|nr:WbqC family protein [Shewanella donghaensis]
MKISIMQPTFLPWSGFFNLMANVDLFIFLDDAQFQKGSWHNRNRIALNSSAHWVTVPINHDHLGQSIENTMINDQRPWREKMVRTLKQVYSKHEHAQELFHFTDLILNESFTSLAQMNIAIIQMMAQKMNVKCQIVKSSELSIQGVRTERLLSILNKVNATHYLSPQGARDYLTDDGFENQNDIDLSYQVFKPTLYVQKSVTTFIPQLSMLDVVMNLGWAKSALYIK